LHQKGSQTFVVLTLCRLLYTLDSGAVASKPFAARWAKKALSGQWTGLIERSLARQYDSEEALESDMNETVALIQHTFERFQQWNTLR
jgi:Domain of unknown function (DUF4111)